MLQYYKNCIIYNPNVQSGIAIVAGWSNRNNIYETLSEENKKKVVACGQLYTKRGINYIIRNLYLNPHINHILICGEDLTDSLSSFYNFITTGKTDFSIDEEIPQTYTEQFVYHFKNNVTYLPKTNAANFNAAINQIVINDQDWCRPQLFPEPKDLSPDTFPSEEMGFTVRGRKVGEVWLRALKLIHTFGKIKTSDFDEHQRELLDLFMIIRDEDINNPELPEYLNIGSVELEKYCNSLLSGNKPSDVQYSYGNRINNYRNAVSQLEYMINKLKETPYSRRSVATLWDPTIDTLIDEVPCLNFLQAVIQDNKLYFKAGLRSNDIYNAFPKNAFGILKLQDYMCKSLEIKKGYVCINPTSAHVYSRDFNNLNTLIQEQKISFCEEDERGNFEIAIDDNNIKVILQAPNGDRLLTFYGKGAQEIRDKISLYVSNVNHAIYLGAELYKAEIALQLGLEYKQDKVLEGLQYKKIWRDR